jgi:hypothetical protein
MEATIAAAKVGVKAGKGAVKVGKAVKKALPNDDDQSEEAPTPQIASMDAIAASVGTSDGDSCCCCCCAGDCCDCIHSCFSFLTACC